MLNLKKNFFFILKKTCKVWEIFRGPSKRSTEKRFTVQYGQT